MRSTSFASDIDALESVAVMMIAVILDDLLQRPSAAGQFAPQKSCPKFHTGGYNYKPL
jgi:hypothetical protein